MQNWANRCGSQQQTWRNMRRGCKAPWELENKMKLDILSSPNLDLLCLMNVLTGDPWYIAYHEQAFQKFGRNLSLRSRLCLKLVTQFTHSNMISAWATWIVSAVPGFESGKMSDLLKDTKKIQRSLSQYAPMESKWKAWLRTAIGMKLLGTVAREVEMKGFGDYWREQYLSKVQLRQDELSRWLIQYDLSSEIESMLGPGRAPEIITLYLCGLTEPHGIRISGLRFITGVSNSNEEVFGNLIHEMFHPPYDRRQLQEDETDLEKDPLVQESFRTKKPQYGYPTIDGFIEENIVEAMAVFATARLGLEKDPLSYFAKHDEGSHKLSVVLFRAFKQYPKPPEQRFESYFQELLRTLPVGALDGMYQAIQQEGLQS